MGGMSNPLSTETLVERNVVWLYRQNLSYSVQDRHEYVKHLDVGVSESKVAVDEPFNEARFDEIKQSNHNYFPFDPVKLVLVPAQNDQFFHQNNKAAFEKSDKQWKYYVE